MRRLTLAAAATLTAALAACSTTPATPGAAAPGGKEPAQTTPATDPTKLQPGTNHNVAAAAYAKKASDVSAWLRQGSKAPNYPDHKIAFLTFDDGPNTTLTPKDLDALKQAGVHATFYYVTKQLGPATNPVARRALAEGHAIDAHSASHNYSYLYPHGTANKDNIVTDYAKAEEALKKTFGADFQNHGIRYPGGHMSWKGLGPADQALADRGLSWIDWNTMTGDAEPKKTHPTTPQGMVDMVQKEITEDAARNPNVAVILMHDAEDKQMTHDALPHLIDQLRREGYEFDVID